MGQFFSEERARNEKKKRRTDDGMSDERVEVDRIHSVRHGESANDTWSAECAHSARSKEGNCEDGSR